MQLWLWIIYKKTFLFLTPPLSLTRPQAEGDFLRHNLDDIVMRLPGAFRTQRPVLQDGEAAPRVLDEAHLAASLQQVVTKVAAGGQSPAPPEVLRDGQKPQMTHHSQKAFK